MKYYLLDDGLGKPYAIFRSPSEYEEFFVGLERLKADGSWSSADQDPEIVVNLYFKGDFDPETNDIKEEKLNNYINEWQITGVWPGRP